jgi:hypothetical protein
MKTMNPQIKKLLAEVDTLSTFAGAAAASAAQTIDAPVALAATPDTDDLLAAYRADEQSDRGAPPVSAPSTPSALASPTGRSSPPAP